MSAADASSAVTSAEAKDLFAGLSKHSTLLLAVSGGPDSTALLYLASRWRRGLKGGPALVAVTVDHGLRKESAAEARAVARLCRTLGVAHRTLRWSGTKPKTGLQDAARRARYELLANEAKRRRAQHVLTAHTLDDQAETILFRLSRGSGLTGLAGMARETDLFGITIVRPLLDVPKVRLVASLRKARIAYADDPSNRDPRFTRPRWREIAPLLAKEGLTPARLALLARRVRRAEAVHNAAAAAALKILSRGPLVERARLAFDAEGFFRLPDEVSLRLLGHAAGHVGSEGPVELGKLEALHDALRAASGSRRGDSGFRRTLAGALICLERNLVVVQRAPARRAGRR